MQKKPNPRCRGFGNGYNSVTQVESGGPAPRHSSALGFERLGGSRFQLLIKPITDDSECAFPIESERAHEVWQGTVHVGAALGPEFSKEAKEPVLLG
jgi:hypothetical protein